MHVQIVKLYHTEHPEAEPWSAFPSMKLVADCCDRKGRNGICYINPL
jgi:hypothetical protein